MHILHYRCLSGRTQLVHLGTPCLLFIVWEVISAPVSLAAKWKRTVYTHGHRMNTEGCVAPSSQSKIWDGAKELEKKNTHTWLSHVHRSYHIETTFSHMWFFCTYGNMLRPRKVLQACAAHVAVEHFCGVTCEAHVNVHATLVKSALNLKLRFTWKIWNLTITFSHVKFALPFHKEACF